MISEILTGLGLWIAVGFVGGVLFSNPKATLTECVASGLLWPLIVPICAIKFLMVLGRFSVDVVGEMPNATRRLWRL